ncbi:MAG TPA: hypothetical protein VHI93_04305, partial [Candidatus Thermoplasmatota archaeon]|nr:hypothetical protein [Candidatus Thermoplasmatota archaeon]
MPDSPLQVVPCETTVVAHHAEGQPGVAVATSGDEERRAVHGLVASNAMAPLRSADGEPAPFRQAPRA